MRVKLALLAGTLFLSAIGLPAQETPDPAKEAEVRRLMDVMGVKKMMASMMPAMTAQLRQQMEDMIQRQIKAGNLPEGSGEKFKKLHDFMTERFTEEMKSIDLESMSARIYSKHFTIEEVRALIQFYESPIGKKMLEKTPLIMQESMSESMNHTQQMLERLMKDLREKFSDIFTPPPPQP